MSWVLVPRSHCFHLTVLRHQLSLENLRRKRPEVQGVRWFKMAALWEVTQNGTLVHCGTVNSLLSFMVQERCRQELILEVQELPFLHSYLEQLYYPFSPSLSLESYCAVTSHSLWPHGLSWNFPGKNTGVVCHSPFQGIFLTQGSDSGLLHHRQILYHLRHQESPVVFKGISKMNKN